jgi:hypothetical protein
MHNPWLNVQKSTAAITYFFSHLANMHISPMTLAKDEIMDKEFNLRKSFDLPSVI